MNSWSARARLHLTTTLLVVIAMALPGAWVSAAGAGAPPGAERAAKLGALKLTTSDLGSGQFATAKLRGGGRVTAVKVPTKLRLPAGRYTLVVKNQVVGSTRFYVEKKKYRVRVRSGRNKTLQVSLGVGVRESTEVFKAKNIASFEDGELTLRSGVAVPDKGDFVAVGITPETPDGLLGRVTNVRGRTVATVPADLVDAVPVGAFSLSQQLQEAGRSSAKGSRKSQNVASAIAKAVSCSSGATMTVQGSVGVSAAVDFDADWGWTRLESAKVVGRITEDANLTATVSGSAECNLAKTALLAQPKRFSPIAFNVGPVPVVLIPTLQVYVDGSASAQATVTSSLTQQYQVKAGVQYRRGDGLSPIGEVSKAFNYSPPTLAASAAANARVLPELSLLVYGLAGPSVNLNGGLKFDAALAPATSRVDWKLNATAGAGASLAVPALHIDERLDDVISGSWLVAEGSVDVTVVPPPPPPPPDPNLDQDADGYTLQFDCDDLDPTINPGADDRPSDGIDQDCSGADAVLGTGRVQATLQWDNAADLDLHMTEPDGTEIYFGAPGPTSTGGFLDYDDNVGCGAPGAVENIFWPQDTADSGTYTVWVNTYDYCDVELPPWHLVVRVDGVVVLDRQGAGTIDPIEIVVP